MATYECTVCKEKIKKNVEKCCSPNVPCREREIYHCGRPMMEVMD